MASANDVTLLIKVLADTSSANVSFTGLGDNIGKVLGMGAAGSASGAIVQASADFQSAMSKVQQAYNNVDFAPGTQNYIDATNKVLELSGTMATRFEDVAASMAQGAKITDEFGNKLPISKVNEFVDASLRLKASSQDSVDALASGQHMAMIDKMFSSQDYKGTASMVAALSTQHPQDEETLWQAAIGISQTGAPLGVTMPQAFGVGNYLSDVGGGGMTGGVSIGRMLLRMDTSADQVLNPDSKYADVRKNRDAQEKLDDLQSSLAVAQQRQSQMYGQHGLKTAYQRDPAAVMASENEIAKLNREIADQQENIAHENDPNRSRPRGTMNMTEMAKTAGMDPTAYADLFKSNPIDALLDFTEGLHKLAATDRGAALTKAGITLSKDQKTLELLSDQPESVRRMIGIAQGEQDNPTAIDQISNVGLGTANAHLQDLANMTRAGVVQAGQPELATADKGIQGAMSLIASGNWADLEKNLSESASKFDLLNTSMSTLQPVFAVLGPALGFVLPGILGNMMRGNGMSPGNGPPTPGAPEDWSAADLERIRNGGLGQKPVSTLESGLRTAQALALSAVSAVGLYELNKDVIGNGTFGERLSTLLTGQGANNGMFSMAAPIDAAASGVTHTGDVIINTSGDIEKKAEEIKQSLIEHWTTAWNAAKSGTPVSGSMGGNIGAPSPAH